MLMSNRMKSVEEDWYPCCPGGQVQVILEDLSILLRKTYRLRIQGMGQFGMKKDFANQVEAYDCFNTVMELDLVSRKGLMDLDFDFL